MRNFTELQKQGYNNITTTEQLNQVNTFAIDKLRLQQKNSLILIQRSYAKNGYFSQEEKDYIFNLYYNFIVNKFEFEKSTKTILVLGKKVNTLAYQHIGMRMLNKNKV